MEGISADGGWWLAGVIVVAVIAFTAVILYSGMTSMPSFSSLRNAISSKGGKDTSSPKPDNKPDGDGTQRSIPWKTIGAVAAGAIIVGTAFWLSGRPAGIAGLEVHGWMVFALVGAAALLVVLVTKPDKFKSVFVWAVLIGVGIWALFGYWRVQDTTVGSPNGVRTTMEVVRPTGELYEPPAQPVRNSQWDAIEKRRLDTIAENEAKRFSATLEPGDRRLRIKLMLDGYTIKYIPPIGVKVVQKCWKASYDPPDDAVFEPCGEGTIAYWQELELVELQNEPVTFHWRFEKAPG